MPSLASQGLLEPGVAGLDGDTILIPPSPSARSRSSASSDGAGFFRTASGGREAPRRVGGGLLRQGSGRGSFDKAAQLTSPAMSESSRRVTWADDEENMEPLEQVAAAPAEWRWERALGEEGRGSGRVRDRCGEEEGERGRVGKKRERLIFCVQLS